jgi:hypothetical protein
MKQFNVLTFDFNGRGVKFYDVMPYFRSEWQDKKNRKVYYKLTEDPVVVTDKKTLKDWVIDKSRYMFWSRCEWECLIAPWPYREETLIKDLKKIDVHEQLMANIDILVDMLAEEFKIQ